MVVDAAGAAEWPLVANGTAGVSAGDPGRILIDAIDARRLERAAPDLDLATRIDGTRAHVVAIEDLDGHAIPAVDALQRAAEARGLSTGGLELLRVALPAFRLVGIGSALVLSSAAAVVAQRQAHARAASNVRGAESGGIIIIHIRDVVSLGGAALTSGRCRSALARIRPHIARIAMVAAQGQESNRTAMVSTLLRSFRFVRLVSWAYRLKRRQ